MRTQLQVHHPILLIHSKKAKPATIEPSWVLCQPITEDRESEESNNDDSDVDNSDVDSVVDDEEVDDTVETENNEIATVSGFAQDNFTMVGGYKEDVEVKDATHA